MKEIIYASATALARAIRHKEVSSTEVVEAHLRRIEEVNPRLNAVVLSTGDRALAEAREADAALARGEVKGPLHGVPMTIKDALDTEGVISTGGTLGRAAFVPKEDATVVKRLRDAGGIMLGKTNLPELSLFWECDNLIHGRCNNPYDLTRGPGGSSGGEAAIIAAGGSPFGIGSDAGGSIRQPAHYRGIAGIKPTSGCVPRTGHFRPPGGIQDFRNQVGPLARYVEDLILVLPIIAGPDSRDPAIVPGPLGDPQTVDMKGLRVSFHTDNGIASPTLETAEAARAEYAPHRASHLRGDARRSPRLVGDEHALARRTVRPLEQELRHPVPRQSPGDHFGLVPGQLVFQPLAQSLREVGHVRIRFRPPRVDRHVFGGGFVDAAHEKTGPVELVKNLGFELG